MKSDTNDATMVYIRQALAIARASHALADYVSTKVLKEHIAVIDRHGKESHEELDDVYDAIDDPARQDDWKGHRRSLVTHTARFRAATEAAGKLKRVALSLGRLTQG